MYLSDRTWDGQSFERCAATESACFDDPQRVWKGQGRQRAAASECLNSDRKKKWRKSHQLQRIAALEGPAIDFLRVLGYADDNQVLRRLSVARRDHGIHSEEDMRTGIGRDPCVDHGLLVIFQLLAAQKQLHHGDAANEFVATRLESLQLVLQLTNGHVRHDVHLDGLAIHQ
eukprot:Skav216346  [mRNA]  locus=scaffold2385:72990:75376:+ [translate_table: standard]